MRPARRALRFLSFAPGLLPLVCAAAAVNSEDLARCAGIASRDARLACYDALAHRVADTVPAGAATARAPNAPVTVAAPPVAAAAPAAPAAAADDDPNSFGLSAVQRHVAVVGPKQESARITSLSTNQTGRSVIVLDNGQTWTVLDDDGFLSNNDQVTIKRASLGSYLMMTPSHHQYRVHRDR